MIDSLTDQAILVFLHLALERLATEHSAASAQDPSGLLDQHLPASGGTALALAKKSRKSSRKSLLCALFAPRGAMEASSHICQLSRQVSGARRVELLRYFWAGDGSAHYHDVQPVRHPRNPSDDSCPEPLRASFRASFVPLNLFRLRL